MVETPAGTCIRQFAGLGAGQSVHQAVVLCLPTKIATGAGNQRK